MKIENIKLNNKDSRTSEEWHDFILALKQMKVGQSIFIKGRISSHRLAISIAKVWLGKRFATTKEKNGYRVGCVGLIKK